MKYTFIAKELIHLGTILLFQILFFQFSGIEYNTTIDINVYDSYVVTNSNYLVFCSGISSIYVFYLIKVHIQSFNNLLSNLILILSNLLLVLVLTKLITIESLVQELTPTSTILLLTQICFLISLIYISVKTGLKHRSKKY